MTRTKYLWRLQVYRVPAANTAASAGQLRFDAVLRFIRLHDLLGLMEFEGERHEAPSSHARRRPAEKPKTLEEVAALNAWTMQDAPGTPAAAVRKPPVPPLLFDTGAVRRAIGAETTPSSSPHGPATARAEVAPSSGDGAAQETPLPPLAAPPRGRGASRGRRGTRRGVPTGIAPDAGSTPAGSTIGAGEYWSDADWVQRAWETREARRKRCVRCDLEVMFTADMTAHVVDVTKPNKTEPCAAITPIHCLE